jgi:hypothetical protein
VYEKDKERMRNELIERDRRLCQPLSEEEIANELKKGKKK